MLGIGGVATYKNGGLFEVLPSTFRSTGWCSRPTARISLPVPHRGKRNESSYTALVAHRVAELVKGEAVDEVAQRDNGQRRSSFPI